MKNHAELLTALQHVLEVACTLSDPRHDTGSVRGMTDREVLIRGRLAVANAIDDTTEAAWCRSALAELHP